MKYNSWSLDRIRKGRKLLTSRTKKHYASDKDPEVLAVFGPLKWWFIKAFLYKGEGADSPEELQRVINQIFRREVAPHREFYVHVINPEIVKENNPE